MFVIADLKAVQPFPFYQRMKGFDTGIIPRKSFLGIASMGVPQSLCKPSN